MATYNYITVSSSVKVRIAWVCSKCGKRAVSISKISTKTQDMYHGFNNKAGRKITETRASNAANRRLLWIIQNFYQDPFDANVNCRCPYCKHKEVWAKSLRFLDDIVLRTEVYVTGICLILAFFFLMAKLWLFLLIDIGIGSIPYVVSLILHLVDNYKVEQYRHLPEDSKPHILKILNK